MNEHPTAAEFEAFRQGQLSPSRRREVFAHLLQGCATCRAAAGSAYGFLPVDPDSYDEIIGRVFQRVKRSVKRETRKARELVALMEKGHTTLLPQRFRGLTLYHELLNRSRALRYENPSKMIELARHATIVARALDPQTYGAENVADLQCRAWAELGNAYRVAEDLEEAEQAFRRAEMLFDQGTRSESLNARLLDLRASYYGDRREFGLSLGALDTVLEIHSRHGNHHLVGRALIKKGLYTSYKGQANEAVQLIRQGLALIDERQDPDLHFAAVHNLARGLMEEGQFQQARKVLSRNIWRQRDAGGRLNLLKLRWLEAQINAGLQEFERAEHGFLEVRQGFLDVEKPYDAAVASLDLAALWLRQGRTTDAKAASLEAYESFRSLGIRREGTGAFLILMKAFQMGQATANLVKSVAEYLRKAQNDPTARFEPPSE